MLYSGVTTDAALYLALFKLEHVFALLALLASFICEFIIPADVVAAIETIDRTHDVSPG